MEDSLLDLVAHLFMAALLAGALCVASVVAAGAIALLSWAVTKTMRGFAAVVHRTVSTSRRSERRPGTLSLPVFPRRLRRP